MGADDQDTPPVELVVGVDDRRFAAALRVLATMIGNISASGEQLFEMRAALAFAAVSQADALLVELAKEPS